MIFDFTKRKFLGFPKQQQHKKCAEILRSIYEKSLQGISINNEIDMYHVICDWIGVDKLHDISSKVLSDRYHAHANKADVMHKEHRLLPAVRKDDRETSDISLGISIYLDHIRSSHNVGSILRTVEAFALGKVYFSGNTPFASHKQVQDASMGAADWVECFQNVSLKELPGPVIAMETTENAVSLYDFQFPSNFTLVVGNEEYGCSDETLLIADTILEIPLRGRKNSLNVANAFAVAAAEICRQKRASFMLKGLPT